MKCSLRHLDLIIKNNKLMYHVMRGLHERISMKINTTLNARYTSSILLCILKREFSKTNTFDLSSLLFSYSCRGELIQISLN